MTDEPIPGTGPGMYRVTLVADGGHLVRIKTYATSPRAAAELVLDQQRAPYAALRRIEAV